MLCLNKSYLIIINETIEIEIINIVFEHNSVLIKEKLKSVVNPND